MVPQHPLKSKETTPSSPLKSWIQQQGLSFPPIRSSYVRTGLWAESPWRWRSWRSSYSARCWKPSEWPHLCTKTCRWKSWRWDLRVAFHFPLYYFIYFLVLLELPGLLAGVLPSFLPGLIPGVLPGLLPGYILVVRPTEYVRNSFAFAFCPDSPICLHIFWTTVDFVLLRSCWCTSYFTSYLVYIDFLVYFPLPALLVTFLLVTSCLFFFLVYLCFLVYFLVTPG